MSAAATIYAHADGVLAQEAHGETVLLRVSDGSYYTLDEVGSLVWACCDGSKGLDELVELVCARFDADPDTVRRDLRELLAELAGEQLLDVVG